MHYFQLKLTKTLFKLTDRERKVSMWQNIDRTAHSLSRFLGRSHYQTFKRICNMQQFLNPTIGNLLQTLSLLVDTSNGTIFLKGIPDTCMYIILYIVA